MNLRSFQSALLLGFACLASSAFAQLPVPRLQSIFPLGAKQGSTVEVEIAGGNLEETRKLYFSHAGITAELVPGEKSKPPRFKVSVAASVPVGEYDARVIGKHGISNPRTFVVSDFAEAVETEPNNQRAEANRVALNTTINGRISPAEDVDWFVFAAKKGQRVLIECKAWRLDSRLDGFMWLYDAAGKQLAASQDEDIRNEKRDPFIDFDVPADGDYFVKLTDFTYNGSGDHFYRLGITALPYIDFIAPLGAKPGSRAPITIYGRNLPGGEASEFKVKGRPLQKITQLAPLPDTPDVAAALNFSEVIRPSASVLDGVEMRVQTAAGTSNAKLLLPSGLKELLEAEPNNSTNQAQRLAPPCAVNGRFDAPKDVDYFVIAAKKNDKFTVRVIAERLGSPADPDLEVLKPDGSVLNTSYDWGENIGQIRFTSNTRDIQHSFTTPTDGDYYLRLEHLYGQGQGGPQYFYRLEVETEPMPDFRLVCQPPHDIRMDSHVVRQGGRDRLDILVWRLDGHNEPITVAATKLPPKSPARVKSSAASSRARRAVASSCGTP
ncbi:MAG: PPC domain-containing protein [Verrucomicrobia bacterium]|nr:PPC domain-containing protein [Verrucomicrobiota bacterium]